MSDEYTIAGNFQRHSDDSRAAAEYEYRMGRLRVSHNLGDEGIASESRAASTAPKDSLPPTAAPSFPKQFCRKHDWRISGNVERCVHCRLIRQRQWNRYIRPEGTA